MDVAEGGECGGALSSDSVLSVRITGNDSNTVECNAAIALTFTGAFADIG